MDYKKEIYEKYHAVHTASLYGKPTLVSFEKQFSVLDAYYGKYLPNDKKAKIIDIACGVGNIVYWLKKRGYENISGIDISGEQVALAKSLGLSEVSLNDCKIYLDGKENFFDAVFAVDILEHFNKEEIADILRKILNALTPGGVLVIKSPNAQGLWGSSLRFADWTHEVAFTESSLRQILSFTGFSQVYFKEAGPVSHGIISFSRVVLWRILRFFLRLALFIETGASVSVLTQNIIAFARK